MPVAGQREITAMELVAAQRPNSTGRTAQDRASHLFENPSVATLSARPGRDGEQCAVTYYGFNGQVWYHTWHGAFVEARDFGG